MSTHYNSSDSLSVSTIETDFNVYRQLDFPNPDFSNKHFHTIQYFVSQVDGQTCGCPLLFFHAMHFAKFLKYVADRAEYRNDEIYQLVDLLNLQRLSVSYSTFPVIDKLVLYIRKFVLENDEEGSDPGHFPENIPVKFYEYLHSTLLDTLIRAQTRSPTGTVTIKAYDCIPDYWVGLLLPKNTSTGKLEDFVRIQEPMVCLNLKDFAANFFFLEEIIGLAPYTHEYCAFYFIQLLKDVFSCHKDLKLVYPKDVHNFFIFVSKFKSDIVGSRYTCPTQLMKFFDDVKDIHNYVISHPALYAIYFGCPLAVRKLEQICNYSY